MAVTAQFQYTVDELVEADSVTLKRMRSRRGSKSIKGLLGWVLFVVLAIMLVFLQSRNPPTRTIPVVVRTNPQTTARVFPWVAILVGLVLLVKILAPIQRRKNIRKSAATDFDYSIVADEGGFTISDPSSQATYKWHAFHGFDETRNMLVAYLGDAKRESLLRFVAIPKRALGPDSLEQLRQLLVANALPHTQAFPVLPPAGSTPRP